MNAIEISNLCFKYDEEEKNILDNLSLTIKKGEFVTFIGSNGSGKSTLMKLIIGLLEPQSGKIKIDGIELNEENISQIRKKVGIVFQNPDNQFIGATVRDDIAFGLENMCIESSKMDDIIFEYAKKVGMDKYLDKEPSELSGGQKQRVAIADSLSMKLDIILFDEATSMLDPKGREDIVSLMHQMKEEIKDMTILNITHHMEEAYLSDRVIVLDKGKILLDDTPINVFKNKELLYKIGLDLPYDDKVKDALMNKGIDISFLEE